MIFAAIAITLLPLLWRCRTDFSNRPVVEDCQCPNRRLNRLRLLPFEWLSSITLLLLALLVCLA